ncbi:MAG: hypothetical protein A2506_11240 [Elusimicrobia bacterium RIFOXYD12_FULL_66_9]|nr:MAG: hypothetical protein A2506_11240 [Elusimicrobia bacterium RIFOXYD12_FULL_66_9]
MDFEEFRRKTRFSPEEVSTYARGRLVSDAPAGLPRLPGSLLLPFHEVTSLAWDEASGTGAITAVRRNRFDEWFYGCHFLSDPVMPGCWGVDAVWQCMKFFAAWRGLTGCDKNLGMENVSFFGQIRPYDKEVVYHVDILSVERDGKEMMITGKGSVSVDATLVYTMDSVQVGTAFWEAPAAKPKTAAPKSDGDAMRPLTYAEFAARDYFTRAEIVALSRGSLVSDPPGEVALLPSDLMLEVGRIEHIAADRATGEGEVLASRPNAPTDWFFVMTPDVKPTALSIDAVWQLIGVFQAWSRNAGTGRALGFERVEVFDDIRPEDRDIRYEIRVLKTVRVAETGDAFVRADATVFADDRPILTCANANVGVHKDIRYTDYPVPSGMAFGGKLKKRAPGGHP